MPRLLPGILELSRRARYFSFHAYLLHRYRQLALPADGNALSTFIKRREFELGLAIEHCPHGCDSSPVGAWALRAMLSQQGPPYPRAESVESPFGGYGLYYRSPMAELGLVARPGTLLGDTPITIDVLRDTARAQRLANTFGKAVEDTDYVRHWMITAEPIPVDVLEAYAAVACLCQLRVRPDERDAVHDALFGVDPDQRPESDTRAKDALSPKASSYDAHDSDNPTFSPGAGTIQRRRSVAHYLSLVAYNPLVVDDEGAYREALWSPPDPLSPHHHQVGGQWAGLVGKDVWQDALCSIWSQFCAAGVKASLARGGDGLAWEDVRALAGNLLAGPPGLPPDLPTADLRTAPAWQESALPGLDRPVSDAPLDALRAWTASTDTATSGLVVILELHRRASERSDPGWVASSRVRSGWQPSVADVLSKLTAHLSDSPTVVETLWWVIHRFVVSVHERIAYSKLPDHTFRFRWEDGRVRFYDHGTDRFPLAAIRFQPLASLTHDLALWQRDSADSPATLTAQGREFIEEVLL